jgi:hypothetical protein
MIETFDDGSYLENLELALVVYPSLLTRFVVVHHPQT